MSTKKYYNIDEVSAMLQLPKHRIRYLDKSLGANLTKIRGRRYYKSSDIDLIRKITNTSTIAPMLNYTDSIDSIIISLKRMKSSLEKLCIHERCSDW